MTNKKRLTPKQRADKRFLKAIAPTAATSATKKMKSKLARVLASQFKEIKS